MGKCDIHQSCGISNGQISPDGAIDDARTNAGTILLAKRRGDGERWKRWTYSQSVTVLLGNLSVINLFDIGFMIFVIHY